MPAALQAYVDENEAGKVTLINDCVTVTIVRTGEGISQPVKKKPRSRRRWPCLTTLLPSNSGIDCEVGSIENGEYDPVSYFGSWEGQGDAFRIGEYLGL